MYLVSTGPYPFTPADIRTQLGLITRALDPVIEVGIATICNLSTRPVRSATWAIRLGGDYERYGIPLSIGEPRRISDADPHLYCDCTYAPDPAALSTARTRILAWCDRQDDIYRALSAEQRQVHEMGLAEVA